MAQEVTQLELKDLHSQPTDHATSDSEPNLQASATQRQVLPSLAIIVILQLTFVTFLTSVSTGLMTVSVPRMASDLNIQPQLYFW